MNNWNYQRNHKIKKKCEKSESELAENRKNWRNQIYRRNQRTGEIRIIREIGIIRETRIIGELEKLASGSGYTQSKNWVCPGGTTQNTLQAGPFSISPRQLSGTIVAQGGEHHWNTSKFCVRVIFDIYQKWRIGKIRNLIGKIRIFGTCNNNYGPEVASNFSSVPFRFR